MIYTADDIVRQKTSTRQTTFWKFDFTKIGKSRKTIQDRKRRRLAFGSRSDLSETILRPHRVMWRDCLILSAFTFIGDAAAIILLFLRRTLFSLSHTMKRRRIKKQEAILIAIYLPSMEVLFWLWCNFVCLVIYCNIVCQYEISFATFLVLFESQINGNLNREKYNFYCDISSCWYNVVCFSPKIITFIYCSAFTNVLLNFESTA